MAGLVLGSLTGGNLVSSCGLWNCILIGNILALISTVLKIIVFEPAVYAGHFLFGFGNGISQVTSIISIHETIPVHWFQSYGTLIFTGVISGLTCNTFFVLLLPSTNTAEMSERKSWILLAAFPMIIQTYVILALLLFFPFLSLTRLV